jgi:hypothetical protein
MTEHDATNGAGSQPPTDDSSGTRAREAAWDDVAAHFSNLGKQLRSRFERPAGESQAPSEASSAREGPGGETVRRWIDTLDDTFTKLGDTVRDPEFRKDAGSSVGRLGQALGVTLRELGDQLQGRFGRARTETAPGEDMPDVPPPPPATPSSDVPPAPASTTPPPVSTPSSEVPPPPPSATPPPTSTSQVPPSEVPPPPPSPTSEVPPTAPGDPGDQPPPEDRPPAP